MWYIYYRIKELCIKLVIKTSLYYDAQSEKHQNTTQFLQVVTDLQPSTAPLLTSIKDNEIYFVNNVLFTVALSMYGPIVYVKHNMVSFML
jgi:hypothetical protein